MKFVKLGSIILLCAVSGYSQSPGIYPNQLADPVPADSAQVMEWNGDKWAWTKKYGMDSIFFKTDSICYVDQQGDTLCQYYSSGGGLWEDYYTNGTGDTIQPITASNLILPTIGDLFLLGDGDTGFFEASDDVKRWLIGGSVLYQMRATFMGAVANDGGAIKPSGLSSTNPTILISSTDTNTGLGGGEDFVSIIGGSYEGFRISETANTTQAHLYNAPEIVVDTFLTISNDSLGYRVGGAIGATTFLGLSDTPSSYTGSGLYLLRVNSGETAIEFIDASTFEDANTFLELTDTPSSYTGNAGKLSEVNSGETAIQFSTPDLEKVGHSIKFELNGTGVGTGFSLSDYDNSSASWNNTTNEFSVTDGIGTVSAEITGFLENEVDGSTTNEAWTIDGDDADTELISNQTVKFEGAGSVTTDYNPTTNTMVITGSGGTTPTWDQVMAQGSKSTVDAELESATPELFFDGGSAIIDMSTEVTTSSLIQMYGNTTVGTWNLANGSNGFGFYSSISNGTFTIKDYDLGYVDGFEYQPDQGRMTLYQPDGSVGMRFYNYNTTSDSKIQVYDNNGSFAGVEINGDDNSVKYGHTSPIIISGDSPSISINGDTGSDGEYIGKSGTTLGWYTPSASEDQYVDYLYFSPSGYLSISLSEDPSTTQEDMSDNINNVVETDHPICQVDNTTETIGTTTWTNLQITTDFVETGYVVSTTNDDINCNSSGKYRCTFDLDVESGTSSWQVNFRWALDGSSASKMYRRYITSTNRPKPISGEIILDVTAGQDISLQYVGSSSTNAEIDNLNITIEKIR